MDLTVALVILVVILFSTTLIFAFNKKVITEIITEIDPELETKVMDYEHVLRSIAFDTKSIKSARKLAESVLPEGKE
jgi:hypothetical protein